MPDAGTLRPGGWNRIQIEVADLAATVERADAGCRFRNEICSGGLQIPAEDPSCNSIELFSRPR